eukprot:15469773-Alexandrium_andersonii.AAC.1
MIAPLPPELSYQAMVVTGSCRISGDWWLSRTRSHQSTRHQAGRNHQIPNKTQSPETKQGPIT